MDPGWSSPVNGARVSSIIRITSSGFISQGAAAIDTIAVLRKSFQNSYNMYKSINYL
jgi:hypothetical protein